MTARRIEMKVDATTPVLVLECHHGSLGIARSLGRLGISVYGVDRDVSNPAYRSRYFRDAFEWDLLKQPTDDSVSFLLDVGRRIGGTPLLIPTSDDTSVLVAERAEQLATRFVFAKQDPVLVRKLTSKRDNYLLAKSVGVPVPETEFPQSTADVREFSNRAVFPVMVKGIDGRKLFIRTGHKMIFANSPAELIDLYEKMEDPEDPNIMLQEYIPGGDDTIWMFDGYFDDASICRAAFPGRKLRQTPPHMGSTSLGILEANDTVVQMTVQFMRDIGYTGILDIGYRYDARDGRYKLLDPNPRIGSTFRLFVGTNGMDVARYLYLDKTGQPLPETTPRYGRKWVVEESDLESLAIYREEGTLSILDWIRSFRGVEEAAWFAADDLSPFWPTARSIVRRVARWCWRAVAGRTRQPTAQAVPSAAAAPVETTKTSNESA